MAQPTSGRESTSCNGTTESEIRNCIRTKRFSGETIATQLEDRWIQELRNERAKVHGFSIDENNLPLFLATLILGNDSPYPLSHDIDAVAYSDRLQLVFGNEKRNDVLRTWAKEELRLQYMISKLKQELRHNTYVVMSGHPVMDTDGNIMPETNATERLAAWRRRQDIYNEIYCPFNRTAWVMPFLRTRLAATTEFDMASDLPTVKQQLLGKYDRAVDSHVAYLFGFHSTQPTNDNQRTAFDSIQRHRKVFIQNLNGETTELGANNVTTSAIATMQSVVVPASPGWDYGSGESITANELTRNYSRGGTWMLNLHAFTPSNSNANSLKAGKVQLDAFEDENFELGSIANRDADGDLNFIVKRKNSTDPPEGSYTLNLVARNFNGPTKLTLTIVVPAAPSE